MELAFTFGAVGDFIAVLELIQKIVAALDESRGSAKEYRDVIRSLQILERTIAHVKDVYSDQSPSIGHGDLRAIALCIVARIKECLEDFCDNIWKFGPSLANGGTKNALRDAARKIQWKYKQGDVEKLHNDLSRLTMPLNMILEMTTLREVRRGYDATSKHINDSESRTTAAIQDSNKSIMEQFGAFEQLVLSKLEVMSEFGTDSNHSAIQIIRMVNAVSKDLNGIKAMLMRLERPLNEEQFIFEDVSGKAFPIHLRTITSWEAFEFIITDRFKGRKGARRIQRGHYSLQERATGRGVSRSVDWQSAFLPNQRVDMSMMYRQGQDATLTTSLASCPRCLAVSPGETGVEIQCTKCNMFFTRVVELDDAPILPFAPTPPQSAHAPGGPPFASKVDGENDNTSSNTPGRGSGGSSQSRRPSSEEESDSDNDDIQGFVRIMLISKAKKANRPASAPTGKLAEVLEATSQTNLRDPGAAVVSNEAEDSVEASPEATSDDDELSDVSSESAQDTTIKQKDSEPEYNYDYTVEREYYYSRPKTLPRRYSSYENNELEVDEDDVIEVDGRTYILPRKTSARYRDSSSSRSNRYSTTYTRPVYSRYTYSPRELTPRASEAKPRPKPRPKPATNTPAERYAPRQATEEDRKRRKIAPGYSLKHWDPTEEPILLLGSVFDSNSLGKWIYDWTVFHHGPATPVADMAGELWLLLIRLAGNVKRADQVVESVRNPESKEILEDFIEAGDRFFDKVRQLLKAAEAPMLKSDRNSGGKLSGPLPKSAGVEFVETIFGREKELDKTERLMQGLRLWNLRFDANCEEIFKNLSA